MFGNRFYLLRRVFEACEDSLKWLSIVMNNNCGRCKLIVKTLCQGPGFVEATRGIMAAKVNIASKDAGKLVWRPVEEDNTGYGVANKDLRSGWYLENGSMVRHIRRIDVSAEINGHY
ncbi:hypothetical protein N7G274_006654 [Stereocaulon virgatum]|uniref:Uncharacterized protein n=1 Tax=Stereocaulon virgatum TaxID=373712 RepID=A0ABR4A5G8_9LECA